MKKLTYLLLACTLSFPLFAQYMDYSRMGKTPAELMFITDPMTIELKETSWWRFSPKMSTPEAQLTYAAGLEQAGKLSDAVTAYDRLVRAWHATPQALTAQLAIARLESSMNHPQEAYDADIYLLAHFSGRFVLEPILKDALAQADFLATQNETNTFLGLKRSSRKALRANYERIIHFAPRWIRTPELLTRIGMLYSDEDNFSSAITIYDRIIVTWPDYQAMDNVVYLYCKACRDLANVWANDAGRLLHIERLLTGAQTFRPNHAQLDLFKTWQQEVYVMRRDRLYQNACFYDNPKAYDPNAALITYQDFLKEFPNAPQAQDVNARIQALKNYLSSSK